MKTTILTGILFAFFHCTVFAQSYMYLKKFGETGAGDGQFEYIFGTANINDTLFVLDSRNSRVQFFDKTGKYLGQWSTGQTDMGRYTFDGIISTPNGEVLLSSERIVSGFNTKGVLLYSIDFNRIYDADNAPNLFDVGVDKRGNIYGSDYFKYRVYKFDKSGKKLNYFQYRDSTIDDSRERARLYMDSQENIYLIFLNKGVISKLDTNGKILKTYIGNTNTRFYCIREAINGNLVVASSDSVCLMDADFNHITTISRVGVKDGEFINAGSLSVLGNGNLYLPSSSPRNDIQVFEYIQQAAGLENEEKTGTIKQVFPNPFQDVLEVNVQGQGEASLELTDLTGRIVSSTPYNFNPVQLNTSQLQKGLYLCRIIQNGKQMFVAKVQK